jgi:hypothetical protein
MKNKELGARNFCCDVGFSTSGQATLWIRRRGFSPDACWICYIINSLKCLHNSLGRAGALRAL